MGRDNTGDNVEFTQVKKNCSISPTNDFVTQDLMVKFYEKLAKDGDKGRALRAAQLHTMEAYPHPKDWAAFVMVGGS